MASFKEYGDYDALGLAELVRKNEVMPIEVLDAAIERIEELNPQINAVTIKTYDFAHEQVKSGLPEGPFSGVPFLLKDLHLNLQGTETSNGSRLFRGNMPDHNSTLVDRYRNAGMVFHGKSNSPELGLTVTTEPVLWGPSRNPWNLEHSTGGSSGGAAAAVAARLTPIANASDGGGSIRCPSAACGIFGLKPTRARTPSGPLRGEGWNGLAISHAVSLTVRDSAALLDATDGPERGDPYAAPAKARPFLEEVTTDPGKLRIGFSTSSPGGTPVDPNCIKAVEAAAKLCEELGHQVEPFNYRHDNSAMGGALITFIAAHTAHTLRSQAFELGRELTPNDVESVSYRYVEMAEQMTSLDYARAQSIAHGESRKVATLFDEFDILLEPTFGLPPVKIGELDMNTDNLDQYIDLISRFTPFTALYNITGNPSMNVPLHWSPDGLPIGTMFTGRIGDEATLFRLAGQFESARPWRSRIPPVHA